MLGKSKAAGVVCALALAACSGGGGGGSTPLPPGGYNGSCDPGTAVSLANPAPNSFGVNPSMGSIDIVASGNNNALYNTYTGWTIILQSNNFSNPQYGGNLSLVPNNSGWGKPYASDFYYQASIPQLQVGTSYTVLLANGGCSGVAVGSFST